MEEKESEEAAANNAKINYFNHLKDTRVKCKALVKPSNK